MSIIFLIGEEVTVARIVVEGLTFVFVVGEDFDTFVLRTDELVVIVDIVFAYTIEVNVVSWLAASWVTLIKLRYLPTLTK